MFASHLINKQEIFLKDTGQGFNSHQAGNIGPSIKQQKSRSWNGLEGISGNHLFQLAKAGSPRTGYTGTVPGVFCMSSERKTPQPP